MINPHDPHSGQQIRFHRTDPSGRWSPIHEPEEYEGSGVASFLGGVAIALVLVAFVAWGLA